MTALFQMTTVRRYSSSVAYVCYVYQYCKSQVPFLKVLLTVLDPYKSYSKLIEFKLKSKKYYSKKITLVHSPLQNKLLIITMNTDWYRQLMIGGQQ